MKRSQPKLPIYRDAPAPPPVSPPFPVGSLVILGNCPSGAPGIVRGFKRNRVLVNWLDLNILGRHWPEALMLADEGGIQ
jgi:hypothetical protein